MAMNFPWSDDSVKLLRALWDGGNSASVIANELTSQFGKVSRSAVIGKAYRLKLASRITTQRDMTNFRRMRATRRANREAPQPIRPLPALRRTPPKLSPDNRPPRPVEIIPEHLRVSMDDLEHRHCRFPFGEGAEITFCGRTRTPGSSYCVSHAITCTPQINLPEPVEAEKELEHA